MRVVGTTSAGRAMDDDGKNGERSGDGLGGGQSSAIASGSGAGMLTKTKFARMLVRVAAAAIRAARAGHRREANAM